jgi:hypothetical protein
VRNPYIDLRDMVRDYLKDVQAAELFSIKMFAPIPRSQLGSGITLEDVYHRAAAARDLGFVVTVEVDANGLTFEYRKPRPAVPFNLQWKAKL